MGVKAIIFAAGKGIRFGKLTEKMPKPLIKLNKRPILEYVLRALPDKINEIIIVTGHLGYLIKNYFGNNFNGKRILYIEQKKLNGTAAALRLAKPFLGKEKFLVLNADDFYQKKDLTRLLRWDLSFGVKKTNFLPGEKFLNVELDKNNNVKFLRQPNKTRKKFLLATGAYILDRRIFLYKPIKLKSGEYGLPQTIVKMAERNPVKAVFMEFWRPVNTPNDLRKVKNYLFLKNSKAGEAIKIEE